MAWIWVVFLIIVIVGKYILDYQKNSAQISQISQHHDDELGVMQNRIEHLEQRIENLEAIAASEPDDFQAARPARDRDPLEDIRRENEKTVDRMARKTRTSS